MSEELTFPTVLNQAQRDLLALRTPDSEIKWRLARGGRKVAYVEVGYVAEMLNRAFGHNWDFEVVEHYHYPETDEVMVLGRLTVRAGGHTVTKSQFGSATVKRSKETDEIISLADDHKAAASDALKKCASLLGVAHDVYRGQVKSASGSNNRHWIDRPEVRRRFWAWAKGTLRLTKRQVYQALGVESIHDFDGTMSDAKRILEEAALATDQAG